VRGFDKSKKVCKGFSYFKSSRCSLAPSSTRFQDGKVPHGGIISISSHLNISSWDHDLARFGFPSEIGASC